MEIGVRLGGYEIVAQNGAGGMGEVYRARDTKLGREVAIKVLPEEFTQQPQKLARFEREARLLAALYQYASTPFHASPRAFTRSGEARL
jgi:serine/threonine protein kinase